MKHLLKKYKAAIRIAIVHQKSPIVIAWFGRCEVEPKHDLNGAKSFREGNEDIETKG
jgi:hypothetical protein